MLVRELEPFLLHPRSGGASRADRQRAHHQCRQVCVRARDHGRIVIRLKKRGDRATLTTSDNGHGKPKASLPGVGTKLVRSLASQIGARLRVVSGPGLTYSLTFPVERGEAEAPW